MIGELLYLGALFGVLDILQDEGMHAEHRSYPFQQGNVGNGFYIEPGDRAGTADCRDIRKGIVSPFLVPRFVEAEEGEGFDLAGLRRKENSRRKTYPFQPVTAYYRLSLPCQTAFFALHRPRPPFVSQRFRPGTAGTGFF